MDERARSTRSVSRSNDLLQKKYRDVMAQRRDMSDGWMFKIKGHRLSASAAFPMRNELLPKLELSLKARELPEYGWLSAKRRKSNCNVNSPVEAVVFSFDSDPLFQHLQFQSRVCR